MQTTQLETIQITQSPRGRKLSCPIRIQLPTIRSKGEEALHSYIINSFSWKMPALIAFTLQNESVMKVAKHLQRHATASTATLYQYIYGIHKFSLWLGKTPDQLIAECRDQDGTPNPKALATHMQLTDDFVGECQAEKLAPGTISNHVKGVKSLYQVNGLSLTLPYRLPRTVKFKDRAPTPEELTHIMNLADLRGKVIVACLALGGFRVGTICLLRYRHVKTNLEQGVVPLHIHVEAEITKGQYGDYDTFLGVEAVDYLKLYLDKRRVGSPEERTPPETITDNSPLIRNSHSSEVTTITPTRVHTIIHNLYREAGLIKEGYSRRYELRAHSIRKFFRTQLAALGVNSDYIDYMMGHKVDTYHDIEMKGIEFLRNIYAASSLSIRPKTQLTKVDMLKEIIRAWGMDPEKLLAREALTEPHRTYQSPADREHDHLKILTDMLKQTMKRELLSTASVS